MSWSDFVPLPSTRRPLTYRTFLDDLLPPILCYFATAVLVILPNTILIRLALFPVTLWTAFRAATSLDLVMNYSNDGLIYWNHGLLLAMTTIAMRSCAWTFQLQPYRRLRKNRTEEHQQQGGMDIKQVALDASDLFFNLRGCGWDWSTGLRMPPDTRATSSATQFLVQTLTSAIWHLVLFDNLHYSVQSFSRSTIGSAHGGTIIDTTLPPLQRYLRSNLICLLSGFTVYSAIQTCYDVCTLIGVLVFRQHPTQWPPAFFAPWKSTSLNDFWTRRWHQAFRHQFISLGGKPMNLLVGRIGTVMGVFFMSAILHDFGMWGMGRGAEFKSVGGYFIMMGVGVALEGMWKKVTGCRVNGWVGWVWTMIWVVGWANMLVDAWARRGLMGSMFITESMRPSQYLLGLVI